MNDDSPSRGLARRDVLKTMAVTAGAAAVGGSVMWSAGTASAAPGGNMYAQQAALVEWRFGMFIHFNMATFSDQEWATGGKPYISNGLDTTLFNPTQLDCRQWAKAAKAAGMKWAALTTKHHDGFCLWPTETGTHSVKNAWGNVAGTVRDNNRKRDVVKEYVEAFRAEGLTPCFYFSIWDKTRLVDDKPMTRAKIDMTKQQLTELLDGRYGKIPVLIIDGWAWKMGHKAVPYQELREHIKSMQPDILIIDHNGQTEYWEQDAIYFEEPKGIWAPPTNTFASCQGVNIVNTGWFWHPPGSTRGSTADTKTRTPDNIVNGHIKVLEKRYCSFLLNCMPNNKGLFDANILATLNAVGPMWQPDLSRPALPAQPDILLYPVTPVSATATSGVAANAVDGKVDWAQFARETWWQSSGSLPQSVTMDLGAIWSNIDAIGYLPRQDRPNVADSPVTTGNITGYRAYVSTDGAKFTQVASGTWPGTKALKYARFPAVSARYVRLEATATVGGGPAIINELDCGGIGARPVKDGTTVPPPPTGAYKLVNRRSGKVIGVNGGVNTSAAAIVQQADTGSAYQQWSLVDAGGGYQKLVNKGSGLLLDVFGKSLVDGGAVIQYRDMGSANQHWLVATSGGYSKLTNRHSGKVLDVTGGSMDDGATVVQWTDNGGTNQQWTLVAV